MQHKKKIIIVLPRGETFRTFVYSGFIQNMCERYDTSIVTVFPNIDLINKYFRQNLSICELKDEKYSYLFSLFNEVYDLSHNRYMWSEASKVRWRMRDIESIGIKNYVVRRLKKFVAFLFSSDLGINILEILNQFLSTKERPVINWINFLEKIKPDLVFNTSHSHATNAHAIIYAANKLNIKTVAFLFSWDNLTSQGRIIPSYNYYFAWNSSIKQDLLRIYPNVNNDSVYVTGTPQFISHFDSRIHYTVDDFKALLGLKPYEKYVLYSSGMSHHLPEEPYVVERIADMIKELGQNIRLVVRTYAKDRFDVFKDLKNRRKDIIIPEVFWEKKFQTPLPEDQSFFSSLIKHCIAGINVASTVSLEICMFDKPAINIGYNPPNKDINPYNYTRFYSYDHYKPIVDSGAIDVAYNEDELLLYMKEAISNPSKNSVFRKRLIDNFFEGNLDSTVLYNFSVAISNIIN